MALLEKFTVIQSSDFSGLIFTDTTGVKPTVSDGYGAPDMTIGSITTVTVSIVFPNEVTPIISANLTNSVLTTTFPLTPIMFQGKEFKDGSYVITFTVTDGTNVASTQNSFYFDGATKCCVAKMLSNLSTSRDPKCFEKEDLLPLVAEMYLMAGYYAYHSCMLPNKANDLLCFANDICKKAGCGCGCK